MTENFMKIFSLKEDAKEKTEKNRRNSI
jgi:hypothetical protein